MNAELEEIWKETIVDYLNVSQGFPRGTEANHEKH
jgi:hypothetical protein